MMRERGRAHAALNPPPPPPTLIGTPTAAHGCEEPHVHAKLTVDVWMAKPFDLFDSLLRTIDVPALVNVGSEPANAWCMTPTTFPPLGQVTDPVLTEVPVAAFVTPVPNDGVALHENDAPQI